MIKNVYTEQVYLTTIYKPYRNLIAKYDCKQDNILQMGIQNCVI